MSQCTTGLTAGTAALAKVRNSANISKSNMRIFKTIFFRLDEAFEMVRMIKAFENITTDCAINLDGSHFESKKDNSAYSILYSKNTEQTYFLLNVTLT